MTPPAGLLTPDLCVIGAGSGGLSAAAGAVQLGASVVLVEAGEMGGDCLNTGCVPSKSLLAAAKAAHGPPPGLGVTAETRVDMAGVRAHVRAVIDGIAPHDSQERFEGLGVTVIRAFARFTGPDEVEAGGTRIRARRFVIATGSRPVLPPIPGLDAVGALTNETIFDQGPLPDPLLILGGGPIGIEMAQAHRRLGARVTVLEGARALGREDPEAAAVVLARLRAEGVEIVEGAQVASAARDGDAVVLTAADGRVWRGAAVLVAAGRAPALEGLGLEAAGVRTSPAGVAVDAGLRSVSNRRVFAVGDAAGGPQFTHVAGWHAGLVIRAALFRLPVKADPRAVPRVTYADPELAQVGPTEAEARAMHGPRLEVLRADFAENDRARAEGATEGFVKLMVVRGRPVGATVVGRGAGEAIGLWTLAIGQGLKIGAVAGMVLPYPTLAEASKRAAGAYYAPRLFANPWVKRAVRALGRLG